MDSTVTIVIAEDSYAVSQFVCKVLEQEGHTVAALVDNGEAAVQAVVENDTDVAILNANLSGMSGIEAARKIHKHSNIPIILISDKEDDTVSRVKEAQPDALLHKPFTPQELLAAIELTRQRRHREIDLRDIEKRYNLLVHNLHDAIWVRSLDGSHVFITPSVEALTGYTPEEFADISLETLIEPEDLARIKESIAQGEKRIAEGTPASEIEFTHRFPIQCKNGRQLHVEDKLHMYVDENGIPQGYVGATRDISEHMEAQKALQQSEERFILAAESTEEGIWDWNVLENEVYFSPRWKRMLGYEDSELENSWGTWTNLVEPDDYAKFMDQLSAHMLSPENRFEFQYRMYDKTGAIRWIENRAKCIVNNRGTVTRMVGTHHDITEDRIRHPLTGLPNEVYYRERLASALDSSAGNIPKPAVLVVEIDNLASIMASYGDAVREGYYRSLADRLHESVDEWQKRNNASITITTTNDYRFRFLIEKLEYPDYIPVLARQVADTLQQPVQLADKEIKSTVSIGIYIATGQEKDANELITAAITALNIAKTRGPGNIEVFNVDMRAAAVRKLQLSSELNGALQRNEFEVWYQPIFYLNSGLLAGFEALLRWENGTIGPIGPQEFVPVAENAGHMPAIGSWVLQEALRTLRDFQEQGLAGPRVFMSVNVSPTQLEQAGYVDEVQRTIAQSGIPPSQVKLEITESCLMSNVDISRQTMSRLSDFGVQLSLDDFGTGYSSLSYLQEFCMDYLKIDRMFVSRIAEDVAPTSESLILLRTIVGLSQNLGLQSIAEGIETEAQRDALKSLGCDFAQGYLYSRPLNRAATQEFLRKSANQ